MVDLNNLQVIPAADLPRRPAGRADALVGVVRADGRLAAFDLNSLPASGVVRTEIDALKAAQQTSAIYADTLEALQAVVGTYVGQGAFVNNGPGMGQYIWSGASWTFSREDMLAQKLSVSDFREEVSRISVANALIPVVSDIEGRVAVWLDGGRLAAAGVSESLIDMIEPRAMANNGAFPLAADPDGRVPLWLAGGALDGVALGGGYSRIVQQLARGVASGMVEPSVTGRQSPLRTDGQSLRRWLARSNTVRTNGGQVRITLTGDSWTEHLTIIAQLAELLRGQLGVAGSGWVTLVGQGINRFDGVWLQNSSGWALYDADTTLTAPPDGCGPNGQALVTSAADQTITISGIENGDVLNVYLGAFDGTLRYSVDGGQAVDFSTSASGEAVQVVAIPLVGSAPHTVVLTTVSGKAAFYGALIRKSTGSGVELSRVGNIGATGADYLQFVDAWTPKFAAALNPDLVLVVLGTNDFRLSRGTIESYQSALRKIVAAYRTANADCGFLFIAPAQCSDTGLIPLSEYRDAMYRVALEVGAEFYNMNESWGSYASESALGQWRDVRHISDAGAKRLAASLSSFLLGN